MNSDVSKKVIDPNDSDHKLLLKYSKDFSDPNCQLEDLGRLAIEAKRFELLKLEMVENGYSVLEISRLIQHGVIFHSLCPSGETGVSTYIT